MSTGLPKQPTFLSIVIGISLVIVAFLAFFRIPEIVKYTGAGLMYIPSRFGVFKMVLPREVIALSLNSTQTPVTLPAAGSYALYTENYNFLSLHNAAVEAGKLTWIKVQSEESGDAVAVQMIDRGLALYDTPFARGRPLITFTVPQPGKYLIIHPKRPDVMYIVPDYFTGQETTIVSILWLEVGLSAALLFVVFLRRNTPKRLRKREVQSEARKRVVEQQEKIRKLKEMKVKENLRTIDEYEPDNLWKKE